MEDEEKRVEKTVASFTRKPAAPTTSKDGTTIPHASHIVDNDGRVWTLSMETDHGGDIVLREGERMPGTGVMLAWFSGEVYLRNDPGAWFVWDRNTAQWAQTGNPLWLIGT